MKSVLFCILCLTISYACTSKNQNSHSEAPVAQLHSAKKSKLDIGPLKLEIIPLEKTEESLLAGVHHAHIDKENDRIIVLSSFNLYYFDGKGRFVTKLNKGRGPDEVLQAASFSANPNKKEICVLDMGRYLKFYDYSGNLIRHIELETFFSMDLHYADEEHLYLVSNYVGGQEDHFIGKYQTENEKITEKFVTVSNSPYVRSTNLIVQNSFSFNDGNLLFFSPSIFSLFEQQDSSFKKVLDLDLGNMLPPLNMANELLLERRSMFSEEIKQRGYVPQLVYAFEFKGFYFVGLDDKKGNCYAIEQSKVNNVFSNGPIFSYLGLPEVESLRIPVGKQKEGLILSCNPSDFFDDLNEATKTIELGGASLQVNANDNPIIITLQ